MASNVKKIAEALGAEIVCPLPDTGGGAFGAARLASLVSQLQGGLVPGAGKRPGRPTNPSWVRHPKVPMSEVTERRLARLAEQLSVAGRKVSPMQVAAQLLEDALAQLPES